MEELSDRGSTPLSSIDFDRQTIEFGGFSCIGFTCRLTDWLLSNLSVFPGLLCYNI